MAQMYTDFYFAVINNRGKLQATFSRRWQAEKFAEEYGYTVVMINLPQ
jgi:hypothetical protein